MQYLINFFRSNLINGLTLKVILQAHGFVLDAFSFVSYLNLETELPQLRRD